MADEAMPNAIQGFLLNHLNKFEVDTKGNKSLDDLDKATFEPLAAGINNFTPSTNETVTNDNYYDGQGWGSSDVTGKRLQFALAGHRLNGNPGQDYIAGHLMDIGDDLKTLFRWTNPAGEQIVGLVTLTAIVPSGGAPTAKQTFSCTVVFNGKPRKLVDGKIPSDTPTQA